MGREGARGLAPLTVLGGLWLVLHGVCLGQYGYFRDELYYLSCAARLDWGFVDHPPLSVALLAAWVRVFGDSVEAVRAPSVLCGLGTVAVCVDLARRMGATGWGVWLAGLVPVSAGMYLVVFHLYTMNALDILIWPLIAWAFVEALEDPRRSRWALFGALVGLALLNKASVLWLVAGLAVGLLLDPRRRCLNTSGPYLAALVAATLQTPHLLWQSRHGWPMVEFARVSQDQKLLPVPPLEYLGQQAVVMNVAAAPVLGAGLVWLLRSPEAVRWRPFGWAFLTALAILLVNGRSRVNYLAPAYPLLIPAGAVAAQQWAGRRRVSAGWVIGPVAVSGTLTAPLGLPVLPIETLDRVVRAIPVRPPNEESGDEPPFQGYADMHGWRELAAEVSRAYLALPELDRRRAVALTWNYGEAAALERFARDFPLPPAISRHNTFWLWGPRGWDGSVAIVVNQNQSGLAGQFRSFERVGTVRASFAMPEQDGSPVWIARGLDRPVAQFWAEGKRYW
jgi:hypothetical protein